MLLRFVLFVAGGTLGAGILWSVAPIAVAYGINWLIPFHFEHFLGTVELQRFVLASAIPLLPIAMLSIIRTGRRMHLDATDGRPALLGFAGTGYDASKIYGRRARTALLISGVGLVAAIASAKFLAQDARVGTFPIATAAACLLFVVASVAAIEFNDLRRTALLGGLHSDA